MTKDEALKLALEALEDLMGWQTLAPADTQRTAHKAITAAKQALAQPEQEPVENHEFDYWDYWGSLPDGAHNLYTAPPEQSQVEETLRYEIDALEAKLADCRAQQQEPVIGTKTWFEDGKVVTRHLTAKDIYKEPEPVIDKSAAIRIATALGWEPKRTWQGLTDEEMDTEADKKEQGYGFIQGALWAEDKLKEKNT